MPAILFGTLREHYILLFSIAGGVALVAGFVGAWIGARFGARAAAHLIGIETADAEASRAEVHAMNGELQTLLIEVERIGEGQRFVARLLAERDDRTPRLPQAVPERRKLGEITPH